MSGVRPDNFGIREVMNITYYNLETHKPEIFLDSLKMSSQEHAAETTYARGGYSNPRLIGWDFDRDVTINVQDALISQKMMAIMAGTEVETTGNITIFEDLKVKTVSSNLQVTLEKLPTDKAANIKAIYFVKDGAEYDIAPSGTGNFVKYAISAGVITFENEGTPTKPIEAGDLVIISYEYEVTGIERVVFKTDKFPGTYKMVGDTFVRDTNGVDHPYQMVVHRAKLMPGFSVEMSGEGDPAVFDYQMETLKGPENHMIEYIKY